MKVPAIALAAVLAISLTGCASMAQNAAEKAVENALSSDGTNVDIQDGKVKIDSSEGSVEIGDGSQLPADWPSDVPAPDGFTLAGVLSGDSGGGKSFTASYTADGDQMANVDSYVQALEGAGWKKESDMSGIYSLTKGKMQLDIIAGFTDGQTSLALNVGPKSS